MKIIMTLNIPDNELAKQLAKDNHTLQEFVQEMKNALDIDASELCPGSTFKITIQP